MLKFLNKLVGLFENSQTTTIPERTKHVVIFDGDQYNSKKMIGKLMEGDSNTNIWVSNFKNPRPKFMAQQKNVKIVCATTHGKEPTDMHIAMLVVHLCYSDEEIREVSILSNDADFFDVLCFVGPMFPQIKFTLGRNTGGPSMKKIPKPLAHLNNCHEVIFHNNL